MKQPVVILLTVCSTRLAVRELNKDIDTEFLWGNLLNNNHMEDCEGDVRITLRWILGKKVVHMNGTGLGDNIQ